MTKPVIFMTDFMPYNNTPPIAQQTLLDYTAWLLAIAQCSKNHVVATAEADKIFKIAQTDMDRYGVLPKYISKRELNILENVFSQQDQTISTETFPEIYENIMDNYLGIDMNGRLSIYENLVLKVMEHWYENVTILPDDIIHATCTGYISPSPIQRLLSNKKWSNVTVTHSYQMGCYGAIPPLRMAVGFLSSNAILPKAKKCVDILHTEYSSLHFQAINNAPDQIVAMTLFGDGFIKYSIYLEDQDHVAKKCLKVLAAQDIIIPASVNEMTLKPGPYSFEMWLSKSVPMKIREEIQPFVEGLCRQIGLDFAEIKPDLIFALHPGGPKIIEHIKEQLGLSEDQIRFSKKILFEHGNIVSATVPYIWKEIIDDPTVLPGTKVVSIAFGPGLTVAGFILEKA
ncbi:MAG: 3-oxoacyl-[acyl-carrier-protein] synthase III C-terminal domain-containing protein [Pseudomonadota bacterium]